MAKKKQFALSGSISRGLSEVVSMAENKDSTFRDSQVPLSRIQLDPDNPRKLAVQEKDLFSELDKSDPEYVKKKEELEKLHELAASIKKSGLIHPVIVYKLNDSYRVVAGERRTLACKLLRKSEIEARVFNEKPTEIALRLVQWFENNSREDLSLKEKLINLKQLLEVSTQSSSSGYSVEHLKEMTGLSKTMVYDYLMLLEAPEDVKEAIEANEITGMNRAVLAAGMKDPVKRKNILEACKKGLSFKELKSMSQIKELNNQQKLIKQGRGRIASRVNLGSTQYIETINLIIKAVTSLEGYQHLQTEFKSLDAQAYKEATTAFKRLLTILEREKV